MLLKKIALATCLCAAVTPVSALSDTNSGEGWGILADLVGKEGLFPKSGTSEAYSWLVPGKVIRQVTRDSNTGEILLSSDITQTGVSGRLVAESSGAACDGRKREIYLRNDNSLLWQRCSDLEPARHVLLNADGTWTAKQIVLGYTLGIKSVINEDSARLSSSASSNASDPIRRTVSGSLGSVTATSNASMAGGSGQYVDSSAHHGAPKFYLGRIESFFDKQQIGIKAGEIIEFKRLDDAKIAMLLYSYTGQYKGRFVLSMAEDSKNLSVTETPYEGQRQMSAEWDGELLTIRTSTGRFLGGYNRQYRIHARADGLGVRRTEFETSALGSWKDEGREIDEVYRKVRDDRIAAAAEVDAKVRHESRMAEDRRRHQAELDARNAQAFLGGFVSGMQDAAASYEQQDAAQQEFIMDTQAKVRAVEEYRRAQADRDIQLSESARAANTNRLSGRVADSAASAHTALGTLEPENTSYSPATYGIKTTGDSKAVTGSETNSPIAGEADNKAWEATVTRKQAEQKQKQEAADRQASIDAAKRRQQEDWLAYLGSEKAGVRLSATKCSSESSYTIIGTRPTLKSCINVEYEALCPGARQGQGKRGTLHNFTGGGSCYGDTDQIEVMACPVNQVRVEVIDVTGCG